MPSACTGAGHPESPERLIATDKQLKDSKIYEQLIHHEARLVTNEQLKRVHDEDYLGYVELRAPKLDGDIEYLDDDTQMSFHSLKATKAAAGSVVLATNLVISGDVNNAFCAVRPPGHHAKNDDSIVFLYIQQYNNWRETCSCSWYKTCRITGL